MSAIIECPVSGGVPKAVPMAKALPNRAPETPVCGAGAKAVPLAKSCPESHKRHSSQPGLSAKNVAHFAGITPKVPATPKEAHPCATSKRKSPNGEALSHIPFKAPGPYADPIIFETFQCLAAKPDQKSIQPPQGGGGPPESRPIPPWRRQSNPEENGAEEKPDSEVPFSGLLPPRPGDTTKGAVLNPPVVETMPPARRPPQTSFRDEEFKLTAGAAQWFQRGVGSSRVEAAAALAQEYFKQSASESEGPWRKRHRKEPKPVLARSLLSEAPSVVQTCRSLLLYVNKQLDADVPLPPAIEAPKELLARLEEYADRFGRRSAVCTESRGWDARAKRVFDLGKAVASIPGREAVDRADKRLKFTGEILEKELKDRGEVCLEKMTASRSEWAKGFTRLEWLMWVARILEARETDLLREGGGSPDSLPPRTEYFGVDAEGIVVALLKGTVTPPRPES